MDEKTKMLAQAHGELKMIPMADGLSWAEEDRRFDRRLTLHKAIADYLSRYVKDVRLNGNNKVEDKSKGKADADGRG